MITDAFNAVLSFTPWVSMLIVLLAVLRQTNLPISARFYRAAWLILAVRCALPLRLALPRLRQTAGVVLPTISVQLPNTAGATENLNQAANTVTASIEHTISAVPHTADAATSFSHYTLTPVSSTVPFTLAQLLQLLAWIWAAGAILFLCWRISCAILFACDLRRNRTPVTEPALLTLRDAAFGKAIPLYITTKLAGPALVGLVCPAVYLTDTALSTDTLQMIFAHESCHAKHRDIAAKWLLAVGQTVCWFNPLAWVMVRAATQDIECACDELVLNGKSITFCKLYGAAILQTLHHSYRTAFSTEFSGGAKQIKARFRAMFDARRKHSSKVVLALFLAIVLLCGTLISCTTAPASSGVSSSDEQSNQGISLPVANGLVDASYFDDAVFLGDSITTGWGIYDTGIPAAHVITALSALPPTAEDVWQDAITHETYNVLERVVALKPSKIYLMFGTNLLAQERDDAPDALLAQYAALIDVLQAQLPDCTLYLQSVLPPTAAGEAAHAELRLERIQLVNSRLRSLADETGCVYLDIVQALCDDTEYLDEQYAQLDGIHIKPEGYTTWLSYLAHHATAVTDAAANSQLYAAYRVASAQVHTLLDLPSAVNNAAAETFVWPVPTCTEISAGYGTRTLFEQQDFHTGIDIGSIDLSAESARVIAAANGTVQAVGQDIDGYGSYVILDHGGDCKTLYAHLKNTLVAEGQQVACGDDIGQIGLTGNTDYPHLHFELRINGAGVDPQYRITPGLFATGTDPAILFPVSPSGYQYLSRSFDSADAHSGVDLCGYTGTPILAVQSGIVTTAEYGTTGSGIYLVIDHGNGYSTLYSHCSALADITVGQAVERGQVVAYLGSSGNSTGPHLHFEIRKDDTPIDPMPYLEGQKNENGFLYFQF